MRALYNILRVIFGVKSCKKRFFIFVAVKIFPGKSNDDNFYRVWRFFCGAMPASARCENLIGVMVLNVRISFFENARPHRVARTRSCSLSPAFSVLNFYSYAFFLQKSLLLLLLFWSLLSGFLTIRMFRPRL